MKNLTATIAILLLASTGFAQSFQKRQTEISGGFGVRMVYFDDLFVKWNYVIPPVSLCVERGIGKHFSIGIFGLMDKIHREVRTYSGYTYTTKDYYHTDYVAMLRGLYHLRVFKHIDIYTGAIAMIGRDGNFGITLDLVPLGIKYRLNNGLAIFTEINMLNVTSIDIPTFGIGYRFLSNKGK